MRSLPRTVWGAIVVCLVTACAGGEPKASKRAADSATAQSPAPTPILGECASTTISDSALGDVRIGQTVADLSARCTVVRDTTAQRGEGQSARVIDVVVGPDTVEAEIVNDRIWRIGIVSPAFRTADSLGVGTRLPVLLAQPGARPLSGEGRVFVMTQSHCGLSFQLSIADTGSAAGRWTVDDLRRLPDVIDVTRVLIVGCAK